jgi:hypothetical protein
VPSIHLEAATTSIQLEAAVVAMSEATRLWETLPMASRVVEPYENPVTRKFDSFISKNLNSNLKKEKSYTCDPLKHGVEVSLGALGCRPYEERPTDCKIMLIICYQIKLDKLNIYEILMCSIPKMCWWLYMRLCTMVHNPIV